MKEGLQVSFGASQVLNQKVSRYPKSVSISPVIGKNVFTILYFKTLSLSLCLPILLAINDPSSALMSRAWTTNTDAKF